MLYRVQKCYESPLWRNYFPLTLAYAQKCAEHVYLRHLKGKERKTLLARDCESLLLFFQKHPPVSCEGWEIYTMLCAFRKKSTKSLRSAVISFWHKKSGLSAQQYKFFLKNFGTFFSPSCHTKRLRLLMGEKRNTEIKEFCTALRAHKKCPASFLFMAKLLQEKFSWKNTEYHNMYGHYQDDPLVQEAYFLYLLRYHEKESLEEMEKRLGMAYALLTKLCPQKKDTPWHEGIQKHIVHMAVCYKRAAHDTPLPEKHRHALLEKAIDVLHHGEKFFPCGSHLWQEALWTKGIIYMALHMPAEALKCFQRISSTQKKISHHCTKREIARSLYYEGLCWERLHNKKKAMNAFRKATTYKQFFYGQVAHAKIGETITLSFVPLSQKKLCSSPLSVEIFSILAQWKKCDAKARNDAPLTIFLQEAAPHIKKEKTYGTFIDFLQKWVPDFSLHFARKVLPKDGSTVFKALYPTLPPHVMARSEPLLSLVHAIIRQETSFHEKAVDAFNGRGLMQLSPETAKEYAQRLQIPYNEAMLLDAKYNVRLGTAMVSRYITLFQGNYFVAMAAYNAGLGRVWAWIGNQKVESGIENCVQWMENIPLLTTKNYVENVLENSVIYHALFSSPVKPEDWVAMTKTFQRKPH